MTNVFKKAVASSLLITASLFATCPDWEASSSYGAGDKISYNGSSYVALRDVPTNTPPTTADNGWFWDTTTETCDNNVVVTADTYIVKVNNKFSTMPRSFFMDQTGVDLKRDHPTGGNATTKVGYDYVSLKDSTYHELDETVLSSGEIKVRFKNNGTTFEKATTVTPEGLSIKSSPVSGGSYTGNKVNLSNQTGMATVEPGKVVVSTSFGQTTVSDNGITTDKAVVSGTVETGRLVLNGVDVFAKIAALEARIAELEAQLSK